MILATLPHKLVRQWLPIWRLNAPVLRHPFIAPGASASPHRVAISNRRLGAFVDDKVTFRWRDSAHKNKQRLLTLPVDEFLRRFLLHVLPRGFVRIRHFGFLASRRRGALVPLCKHLLPAGEPATPH